MLSYDVWQTHHHAHARQHDKRWGELWEHRKNHGGAGFGLLSCWWRHTHALGALAILAAAGAVFVLCNALLATPGRLPALGRNTLFVLGVLVGAWVGPALQALNAARHAGSALKKSEDGGDARHNWGSRGLYVLLAALAALILLSSTPAAWSRDVASTIQRLGVEDRDGDLSASEDGTGSENPFHVPTLYQFDASKLQNLDHLVMVAGHAVVLAEGLNGIDDHEEAWYLEAYQRGQDLPGALVGHIRKGIEAAAADPRALLVFSGGQTRSFAGPRDEGSSYYRVAEHYGWWGHADRSPTSSEGRGLLRQRLRGAAAAWRGEEEGLSVPQRTVTEDFAADSFQNLLFSLCRFKEVVGRYPSRITVVSFDFKQRRFQELHRRALRLPEAGFSYIGLQPPEGSRFDLAEAARGELEHASKAFEEDPYGCHTPALVAKREARNPFRRTTPYPLSCPEVRELLEWCGPGIFPKSLPWSASAVSA